MLPFVILCTWTLAQPAEGAQPENAAMWRDFYAAAARQYRVVRVGDDQPVPLSERAVFEWASIDDYHGSVFAWTEQGRPTVIGTVFSFPRQNSQDRLVVHEFASFAESEVEIQGPMATRWRPPPLGALRQVPDASPPPSKANLLKLHARRLAKDFSAHMLRRGERWDLRLLTTALVEYQQPSDEILGGALFGFVGYSTDPEILLLLEARQSSDGPLWHFHALRFSDKSLYLSYKDKPIWESLRAAHGPDGADTEDPQYRVLTSQPIPADAAQKLAPDAPAK
jgi:hypothetical protein